MENIRKIVFLTGTRADFGKLKPLIKVVEELPGYDCATFATGMHMVSKYGFTIDEVRNSRFRHVHTFINQMDGEKMELVLANTISGLSRYVHEYQPDMIVVHGDRIEALAGATVGALRNILVAHVEGGELSGTVDELIRHSVSKLSHIHFVANEEAAVRLRRLGEQPESIFVIGSPDIDIMLSTSVPSLEDTFRHYEIDFPRYAIALFHPVTTELSKIRRDAEEFVQALIASGENYVMIYPNNDEGNAEILAAYEQLKNKPRFRIFPSIRFEFFLSLLKSAQFIIGNSSAGVREAPVYGVPTVSVGTRQRDRFSGKSVFNVEAQRKSILEAIGSANRAGRFEPLMHFGSGDSAKKFKDVLLTSKIWNIKTQKSFYE